MITIASFITLMYHNIVILYTNNNIINNFLSFTYYLIFYVPFTVLCKVCYALSQWPLALIL